MISIVQEGIIACVIHESINKKMDQFIKKNEKRILKTIYGNLGYKTKVEFAGYKKFPNGNYEITYWDEDHVITVEYDKKTNNFRVSSYDG